MNRRNERNWDDRGDRMHRGNYMGDRVNDRFQANERDHGPGRRSGSWDERHAGGVHSDWPVAHRPGLPPDYQRRSAHEHGGGFLEQGLRDPRSLRGYGDFEAERELSGVGGGAQERNHRGRGPRGYQRSDARLYEEVCERLSEDPQIDASDISVEVRDGIATLEGTVDQRWVKHHVENVVAHVSGIDDVVNRLEVDRSAGNSRAREMMDGDEGERGEYPRASDRREDRRGSYR